MTIIIFIVLAIMQLLRFYNDNINELVAEVGVLGDKVTDTNLLNKVKEVLSWK